MKVNVVQIIRFIHGSQNVYKTVISRLSTSFIVQSECYEYWLFL
jgi:hypothetical protein